MLTPAAMLEVFLRDMVRLGALLIAVAVAAVLPAALLTLIAAHQKGVGAWRTCVLGAVWNWLTLTVSFTLTWIVLWGIYLPTWRTFQWSRTGAQDWLELSFVAFSLLLSTTIAFVVTSRYFAAEAERRLYMRRTATSPSPSRFAFSLRTLVLIQLAVVFAFGLWLANRRDSIHFREQRRQQLIWQADVRERLGRHWNVLYPHRPLSLYDVGPVSDFNDEVLDKLLPSDEIRTLKVESDHLTDAGLAKLAHHPELTYLDIRSPQVTDRGVAQLAAMPQLETLEIHCPKLTASSLVHLQKISTLKRLSIHQVKLSRAAAQAFSDARPDIGFNHDLDWSEVRQSER